MRAGHKLLAQPNAAPELISGNNLSPESSRFQKARRAQRMGSTRRLTKPRWGKMLGGLAREKYIYEKSLGHIDVLRFSCFVCKYGWSRILDEFHAHIVNRIADRRFGTSQPDAIFPR